MISNPITAFVTGNDEKSFTYEGGSKLFHFSPKANNLSKYMDCNVAFFADSEAHALDVLRRMFEFHIECCEKYLKYISKSVSRHKAEFTSRRMQAIEKYTTWLEALVRGEITVSLAPTNQFYKVGWAENDII